MKRNVRRAQKNRTAAGSRKARRRRRRRLKKAVRVIVTAILSLAAVLALSVLISEVLIRVEMPADTVLTLACEDDGTKTLSWPDVPRAGQYEVSFYSGNDPGNLQTPLFSLQTRETSCILPEPVAKERTIVIRINTDRMFSLFGKEMKWKGRNPLTAVCTPEEPVTDDIHTEFDSDHKTMSVYWGAYENDGYRLYCEKNGGDETLVAEEVMCAKPGAVVTFGEGGTLPVPARGETLLFFIRAMRVADRVTILGKRCFVADVTADDLMNRRIEVSAEPSGENSFLLSWNESAGEGYEVQMYLESRDEWQTLARIGASEDRVCDTGRLPSGRTIRLRVTPSGGKALPDSVFAAIPGEIELVTDITPLYATIWPMKQLAVYRDKTKKTEAGSVPAGKALCVLEEASGMFRVMTDEGEEGYIDATACMINLPDYVGDNCLYDITNSYACIYRVQGYAMPGMTGQAIPGDEHEILADGTFVVPLLYPVAKDFLKIIDAAKKDGYIFKIYSAFRPLSATNYLYHTTAGFLNQYVPQKTWERITVEEYLRSGPKLPTPEELPSGEEPVQLPPEEGAEGDGIIAQPVPDGRMTYNLAMTNGVYSLNWFFASGANSHNFGTAIDLTIARLDTGEECEMQSPIHELSWLSTLDRNNEYSDRLQQYMKDGGYATLFSEWWHFQDNEAHGKYGIGALQNGISIEGWKRDDHGWKYRKEDGVFYRNESAEIGGRTYAFDENGYAER